MSSKLTALTDLAGGQVPTDLFYIVDLSAGANGSKKTSLNDFLAQITKNITAGVVGGIDGSGNDAAGNNLPFAGGKGTGSGSPGLVVVRYPLTGASGSALQSLSSSSYPVVTNMFTSVGSVVYQNSTTETSLFGSAAAGATRTIEAGMARVGQVYQIVIDGTFTTTASPTLRLRVKLGSTTIADTTALALAPTSGFYKIVVNLHVTAIGAAGTANVQHLSFQYISGSPGTGNVQGFSINGAQTIDFTASQVIDVTAQWGAASASNVFVSTPEMINILR
jgi:hypothetical protein